MHRYNSTNNYALHYHYHDDDDDYDALSDSVTREVHHIVRKKDGRRQLNAQHVKGPYKMEDLHTALARVDKPHLGVARLVALSLGLTDS